MPDAKSHLETLSRTPGGDPSAQNWAHYDSSTMHTLVLNREVQIP